MKLKSILTTLTALLFGAFTTQAAPDGTRPNVILIMADDMGYEASVSYRHLRAHETPMSLVGRRVVD